MATQPQPKAKRNARARPDSRWINPAVQHRSRDSLERILAATERLMARRSFRDITVAEIAQEASASPTSIYARFQDKQALLGAVFERHALAQRELIGQLLHADRWHDVPLAATLRQTFPVIVEGYRAKQGLIRAFVEQASEDSRFRQDWAEVGEFVREQVTQLVQNRSFEVGHPDLEQGVRLALDTVFATLVIRILMRDFQSPQIKTLTDELIGMMLRYMGIVDVTAT
jgi:AcrR family transcriptional regulator